VADRLAGAARLLEGEGFRLKAWDCYRPLHVQWAMWKLVPRKGYVADPHNGSHHNRGAAVDVTLVTASGAPVEMPTSFDSFGPAAHHGSSSGTAEARAHRETLRQAMVQAGFRPNRMEWWHYDAPERRGAPLLDIPLVQAP
jgi:D-alanyl-D-alanine dipeptidase